MSSFPTCQVCNKQFSLKDPAPFLLLCLHAVCETCMRSADGQKVSCSTCQRNVNRTETPLQNDVVREQEILHLTIKHQPELVLCTLEDDGNQAICWCKECDDFLCENCQMVHGNFKATKKHAVLDIGELQPADLEVEEYCTIHQRHPLEIWDETCRKLICYKCKHNDHADHKTVDFDEAAETAKKEVELLAKEVQSTVDQHGARLTEVGQDLQSSDETCDTLTENISHTFNTLRALMDQREKELMITLQQHQEKVRREMSQKRDTSEVHQRRCQVTSDYINKTLLYSSRRDIMSLSHLLQSKTGDCTSSAHAVVHDRRPLARFNTDGLEKIKSFLAGFGAISLENDPALGQAVKDCGTQTEDWVTTECEKLKEEMKQLKTSHEKEIQSLRENMIKLEDDTNVLYQLKSNVSDEKYTLKCPHVEFSNTKYNAGWVHINTEGELVNRPQTNPPHSDLRLKKYRGTSSSVPLQQCGSPQYMEVKMRVRIDKTLGWHDKLLEIGLVREEEQDQFWIAGRPHSYSLNVRFCPDHNSICSMIEKHDDRFYYRHLSDTLKNTPGTSSTLHFGVVYDSARSRIAFLDVQNEKIIAKIDMVDSSVPLWAMFGFDVCNDATVIKIGNPGLATVSMSLVVGTNINMTQKKKALVLECLS